MKEASDNPPTPFFTTPPTTYPPPPIQPQIVALILTMKMIKPSPARPTPSKPTPRGSQDFRQRSLRRPRPGRRWPVGEDCRRARPQDESETGSRHLRRARWRAELRPVLLPRRHGLRVL